MARKNSFPGSSAGRHARSLGTRSAELGFAAPQVVAIRLGRMMQPGLPDTVEFQRMFTEKQSAFWRAGLAMAQQAFALQMSLGGAMLRGSWGWSPWSLLSVLDRGMAPIHATATANLRRLSRKRN
ncbi:hypothetical protein SNE35_29260 [Paucibacter sp. R3-3]|uniref:Phasin domain-containing protein n=1 Tax=Roseateles agri TaxID=3098619 RepID=A0ABU5DQM6_9BURK|nr:hypothetical protein [Paucibacter sp. R3-3]MDY0748622.1 hypothetical protein [Paucibacter sp. R3-3]